MAFVKESPVLTAAGAILILLGLYLKPRLFLWLFLLILVGWGVIYLVSSISSVGISQKKELLRKSEPGMTLRLGGEEPGVLPFP